MLYSSWETKRHWPLPDRVCKRWICWIGRADEPFNPRPVWPTARGKEERRESSWVRSGAIISIISLFVSVEMIVDYYCWRIWCERKILFWLIIHDRLRPSEQAAYHLPLLLSACLYGLWGFSYNPYFFSLFFLAGTVFFFHNKSDGTVFRLIFLAKWMVGWKTN